MAQNSLSPGFVKLFYTVAGRPHIQIIPVAPNGVFAPGTDAGDVEFFNSAGVSVVTFAEAMDSYDDILDDFLSAADGSIALAEYWQQPLPTDDPEFVSVYEIGHAGAAAGATVAYSQKTTTFRTSTGGYYKHVVIDQTAAVNVEDAYPFGAGTPQLALWNYVNSLAGGWIRGRDGGRLISGINCITKTNDAVRRKYLLG